MLEGLTENHARSLLASVQHAAQLLRDCEDVLTAAERPQPLSRYSGPLSPPQQKIARDYLGRLRQQLLRFLEGIGLPIPQPSIDSVMALSTSMMFLDDAFEEMRGRYLRGYGPIPAEAEHVLEGYVAELQALVREAGAFLTGAPSEVLRQRVHELPDMHPVKRDLEELLRIITDHGLVDLRPSVGLILDRTLDDTFEVAVVGRVSSGKSTLLNALLGSPVLPAGVLPVTAFPTRLRRGPAPLLRITTATTGTVTAPVEQIEEFVAEAKNPGNEKRLTRLIVEIPSARLPEGVTFVDTPGLGSLATSGALQTFAYLPRCDHATFLLDATSPVTEEDLSLLLFLRDADITTSVLLSKADLLAPPDLAKVQAYVARQLRERLKSDVPIRPISAAAAFRSLVEDWIQDEVRPLGELAQRRAHEGVIRKVDRLRRQTLSALEVRHGPREGRRQIDGAGTEQRLREVAAALEETGRDLRGIGDHRESVVEAAIRAATEVYVTALGAGDGAPSEERVRAALTAPVQDLAERVAVHLADRARAAREALATTLRELGSRESPEESDPVDRGVPVFDIPPLDVRLNPPVWTHVSHAALASWVARRLESELAPTLERAVAAYVDVLKRWATDALARIRRDFESQSRPLLTWLAQSKGHTGATALHDPEALKRDLAWLRQGVFPSSDLHSGPASLAAPHSE